MPSASLTLTKPVFLVDDDADVRRSFRILLQARGFIVHAFETGTEFLANSEINAVGVFLLDYRLPDMNGIDLLSSLRSNDHTNPAYLITGDPLPSIRTRARAAGFLDVIEKPANANRLADLLRMASR